MNDMQRYNSRNDFSKSKFLVLWITALLFIFTLNSHAANTEKRQLQVIEIAGISINTSPEMIAGILQAQGYTQVNESLYTKQEQAQSGRNAIHRIEIENTATFRQITYSRSLGGGRVKSPIVHDAPVPTSEIDMAQQLYHAICTDIPTETQENRSCEPLTPATIRFGHGQWIQSDAHFAVLLDATNANTAIGIKYTR